VGQKVLVLAEHNVAALAFGRALFQVELMVRGWHYTTAAILRRVRVQSERHVRRKIRQNGGRAENFTETTWLDAGWHRGHGARGQQRLVHRAEPVVRGRQVVHHVVRRLAVIDRFLLDAVLQPAAGRVQQAGYAELSTVPVN